MDEKTLEEAVRRSGRFTKQIALPLVSNFCEIFEQNKLYDLNSRSFSLAPKPWRQGLGSWEGRVGPFCAVSTLKNKFYMEVVANDILMDAMNRSMIHTGVNCNVSFNIIEWKDLDVALVSAVNTQLISDAWIAFIRPGSIPGYEKP